FIGIAERCMNVGGIESGIAIAPFRYTGRDLEVAERALEQVSSVLVFARLHVGDAELTQIVVWSGRQVEPVNVTERGVRIAGQNGEPRAHASALAGRKKLEVGIELAS